MAGFKGFELLLLTVDCRINHRAPPQIIAHICCNNTFNAIACRNRCFINQFVLFELAYYYY